MADDDSHEAFAYPEQWWKISHAWPLAVPRRPEMPEAAAAWLEARLRESQCFLEYGMGGSTFLAAEIGVSDIATVESDANFARAVTSEIESAGFTSRLHLVSVDLGPTGHWGRPRGFRKFGRWPSYALDVWEQLREKELTPDLILIDGRFRVGCFFASLIEAQPGTRIMFDDYEDRGEMYSVVEPYLLPSEMIDRAAIFVVPEQVPLRDLAFALARYVSRPA